MTDAGFSASGSGDSAVTFTHDNVGRIIFHRPHPVAKLDQTMLIWNGKRLNKRFGMDRDSFVCAANVEKGKKDISSAEGSQKGTKEIDVVTRKMDEPLRL
jgi:hypothetical protein